MYDTVTDGWFVSQFGPDNFWGAFSCLLWFLKFFLYFFAVLCRHPSGPASFRTSQVASICWLSACMLVLCRE